MTMTGIQQTVAVWAPSMVPFGRSFRDQTVRMVVRPSAGGTRARLRLSNLHGPAELTVGAVSVAPEGRPPRPVSFDGATKAVIGRGRELLTDVLPVDVERGQNLLVSVYLPGSTGPSTHHRDAFETTYVSAPRSGDLTAEDGLDGFTATETSWYFLAGLTVTTDEVDGTLVAFGDSITDGANTTTGANRRWPDLVDAPRLAVVNAGTGGNRLLSDWTDSAGVRRFAHDALGHPGIRAVIVLTGINDILGGENDAGRPLTARDLVDGYRSLIREAHESGVRVIGGTLLPSRTLTDAQNALREEANEWIRTGRHFDGVADFERVMADPDDPRALAPGYDSGDGLHPNDAGMAALAGAVDPTTLT
ncbi:hypothetical protein AQJ43_34475 [Streptomyces avermitilis]|nr:hypothetical protein AQJ43_34475 [Streptomyces avermitilis]